MPTRRSFTAAVLGAAVLAAPSAIAAAPALAAGHLAHTTSAAATGYPDYCRAYPQPDLPECKTGSDLTPNCGGFPPPPECGSMGGSDS